MRLFDASSVIEALLSRRRDYLEAVIDAARTELTLFEVCNVVSRSRARRAGDDDRSPLNRIEQAGHVVSRMELRRIDPGEVGEVYRLVHAHSLSFYDASYLYVAIRDGYVLVTEDEGLRRAAVVSGTPVERVSEVE